MTIAIYARQSVFKEDSLSIDTQIETCRAEVERREKGADIKVYEDRGYSGKNTARPQLKNLMEEIENNRIDKVIVYKLDRISRNVVDFYNLYDFMNKHHCDFVSVKDEFDTSSSIGRLLIGILINFAQMERENIQLRVKDSYYARAETDGRWLGGKTPYAFKLAKDKNGLSTLKPTADKEIIELLYKKYAFDSNTSLHKLTKFLYDKKGISKTATAINNILSNPIYAIADQKLYNYYKSLGANFLNDSSEWNGERACCILNKTDQSGEKTLQNPPTDWKIYITNWKGYIDSRTFLMVQERLSQNTSYSRDNTPKGKFAELSGLVKCAKCGRAVKIKGKYGSMSCSGRSELRGVCDISFKGVKLEGIQEKVAIEIQKYLDDFTKNQLEWKAKLEEYQKQADSLQTEINNLISTLAVNPTIAETITKAIEEREQQLAEVNYKIQADIAPSDKIEYRVLKVLQRTGAETITAKDTIYKDLATEEKQALLKILVNKILLDESGNIEIDWKI